MWNKLLNSKGTFVTSSQLHLKNTLMNGQCFNWKVFPQKQDVIKKDIDLHYDSSDNPSEIFIGCVNKNIIALKSTIHEGQHNIYYKFLYKSHSTKEIDFFSDYFQLDIDIVDVFNKVKPNLPKDLQSVMETYTGVRILKQDPFECIMSFICSSNNNIDRIRKMLDSFKEKYGDLLYEDPIYGKFYSFPSLEELSRKNILEKDLRDMGFGYRAKYIVESLKFMQEKNSENNWFLELENSENPVEELLCLTGVGRKVADCIQLFSLRKHHVVPLDIHMVKFFNESVAKIHKFKKIENLNKKTYEEVSENYIKVFGEYAGWLHSIFYMNRIDKENKSTEKKGKKRKAEEEEEEIIEEKIEKKVNQKRKKVSSSEKKK
jgi:N-glycosylase/DNA lyase